MSTKRLLLATNERLSRLAPMADVRIGTHTIATRDHDCIRQWAARHHAEPATGQATPSGVATLDINDGGAGIRFNFPGAGRFRSITWREWFENFERNDLIFVYEEEDPTAVAERAYELWNSRGREDGRDREDWFEAERQLRKATDFRVGASYRLVKNQGAWFDSLPDLTIT